MTTEQMLHEIRTDIKEIKVETRLLTTQGAVHNHLLKEHEQRSLTLKAELDSRSQESDTRLRPLENDFAFRQKLYVLVMGSSGLLAVAALTVSILNYLKH